MKKINIYILLFAAICFGLALAGCYDENEIRNEILTHTPIGSKIENVKQYCSERKLKCLENLHAGFLNRRTNETVGVTSMRTYLPVLRTGELENTSGTIYWGFDTNGALIEIWVWVQADSL